MDLLTFSLFISKNVYDSNNIIFIFNIFSNLSYSDDNNQLQISKPPINIEPFTLKKKMDEENF